MTDDFKNLTAGQCRQDLAVEKTQSRVVLLAFAFVLFGLVPLGGLPGLLIFNFFAHTLISFLPGSHTWCRFYPDAILPFILCITFLWPISLPVGYAVAFKKFTARPKSVQVVIWLVIIVLWGALLSVGLCLAGAKVSADISRPDQPLYRGVALFCR